MEAGFEAQSIQRFRTDLLAALGNEPVRPIAIAVSGGPDSMAMLALANAAFPGQVIAATVDHRTRAATAAEAAMVGRWCEAQRVPHATLTGAQPLVGSDLQARARRLRYDLLARWAIDARAACLVTAHHADDQAETFLMRANRGTGPAGLASIRSRRIHAVTDRESGSPQGGPVVVAREREMLIVRPLLGWRRAELHAVVEALALPTVDDPGNRDDRFERTRMRRLLAENGWLDPLQFARAAAHAREAHDALDIIGGYFWHARKLIPTGIQGPDGEIWIDTAALPREIKRRLAREAIRRIRTGTGIMRPGFDEGSNIEPLLDALDAGGKATQAGVLACAQGSIWRFGEAPARRT